MTSNFPAILESRHDVVRSAIPAGVPVSAKRLITGALIAWNGSEQLQACDPGSLVTCVVKAAQLGLDPSGSLGEAHLVPLQGKATLIIGYQGMIAIARRSGVVRSIRAHVVGAADEFDYALGLEPTLIHKPARGDRGAFIAAYAVADLADGDKQFEVMFQAEIDAIRARSRAGKSGPWVTDYPEMAKKTVIRRLFKYLPKSVQLMEALEHDNETAGLEPITVEAAPPAPARSAREQVRARLAPVADLPESPVAARPTVAETVQRTAPAEHEDPPRPARVAPAVAPAPGESAAPEVVSPEEAERRALYAEVKKAATADPKGWQARTGRSTLMGVSRMGLDAMREVHAATFPEPDDGPDRLPTARGFADALDAEEVPGPQDEPDDGSLPF